MGDRADRNAKDDALLIHLQSNLLDHTGHVAVDAALAGRLVIPVGEEPK